jgi:hypothetical protein
MHMTLVELLRTGNDRRSNEKTPKARKTLGSANHEVQKESRYEHKEPRRPKGLEHTEGLIEWRGLAISQGHSFQPRRSGIGVKGQLRKQARDQERHQQRNKQEHRQPGAGQGPPNGE